MSLFLSQKLVEETHATLELLARILAESEESHKGVGCCRLRSLVSKGEASSDEVAQPGKRREWP